MLIVYTLIKLFAVAYQRRPRVQPRISLRADRDRPRRIGETQTSPLIGLARPRSLRAKHKVYVSFDAYLALFPDDYWAISHRSRR